MCATWRSRHPQPINQPKYSLVFLTSVLAMRFCADSFSYYRHIWAYIYRSSHIKAYQDLSNISACETCILLSKISRLSNACFCILFIRVMKHNHWCLEMQLCTNLIPDERVDNLLPESSARRNWFSCQERISGRWLLIVNNNKILACRQARNIWNTIQF